MAKQHPSETKPQPSNAPTIATPPTMSPKDVISVLAQWELELTQLEQQRRSLKYIREVMAAFQEATRQHDELTAQHATLTASLAELQHTYDQRRDTAEKALAVSLKEYEATRAAAEQQATETATKAKAITQDLAEKEKFATARAAQLDTQLTEKARALEELQSKIDAVVKKYAVGA